ncbi:MAG: hypothetical protein HOP15_10430 [Planctomycetes bacterium]|nr:hypothetical protein [Planctomycetota bacterium]
MVAEPANAAEGGASPGPPLGRRAVFVGWLAGWPRGTRFASLCLALMILPGLLAGGAPLVAMQVLLFYLGWVLLPGLAFAALLVPEEDEFVSAGMGLVLGTVLLGLLVFFCRATGLFGALFAWPAVTLVFWTLLRRRTPVSAAPALALGGKWLFLALLAVALVRVPTGFSGAVDGWYLLLKDLVFHGGNAAELLKEGPLLDPRVAGRPLNYHLLSHALPAAASVVTGESIADLFRYWFLGFYPLVLMLLVFALARELGRSSWAGFVAVLVLVLHNDFGQGLFEEKKGATLEFTSHLNLGLFVSPTTCLGLALLAAQGLTLLRWCDPERRVGAREVLQLTLLALGASLAKGSVMPVAIAGGFFACLMETLRTRRVSLRWLAAALVLLGASLPATLYLSLGPGSYAGAMFRFAPWASALTSKMGVALLGKVPFLQEAPVWLGGPLVALPWFPGFLGMGGIGALAWIFSGRPCLRGIGPWILGACLAGLGAGVLLLAPGASQLFFAYNAQVLLAIPAGIGALDLWRRRRGKAPTATCAALVLLALPFVAGGVGGIVRDVHERLRVAHDAPALWPEWCEGAAWLRENTGLRALLVANDDGLLLTQFAERRVALAEAPYTPEAHATRWQQVNGQWRIGPSAEDPFLAQKKACETALRKGDVAALARVRISSNHAGELYLIRDNLEGSKEIREVAIHPLRNSAALDASPGLERVFRNDVMAIYRVVE